MNEGRLDVAPLTASVERREVTSQTTCRDELNNKVHKSVKLKGVKLMTQRAEGNLIGAKKKESNLTIKQAISIVFITLELEKIIEFRTKGTILRSKTRWYNEG